MRPHICLAVLALCTSISLAAENDPIHNRATEQSRITTDLPDGGLPPAIGVQNRQIFRATRARPDLSDGKGWTYNHHVDLACWKGRLYVAWDNGEQDEDVWPARTLYSSSEDGITWTEPRELFPQGMNTSLRMYFFVAPNGRMLAIGGIRASHEKLSEAAKRGAVVREIRSDHSLGEVFTLIPAEHAMQPAPAFRESADQDFVAACEQLLSNRPFLETQDYGVLLGERRMAWHEQAERSPGRFRNFGKAFSFFHRKDGALVGIGKRGWTVVSTDEGETWSSPVIPESLLTNNAKVWGQRTSDGRYALVFNPTPNPRYPLVMISGEDGITFDTMRVVHGEVPRQRYAGRNRSVGPQYVRGISEWSTDGSRKDAAMWLVYSVNKEDIWVSQVPIPQPDRGWRTYSPKWAPVVLSNEATDVTLEDGDPYDYARAQYIFSEAGRIRAEFKVEVPHLERGMLKIELLGTFGDVPATRLTIAPDGSIVLNGGKAPVARITAGQALPVVIEADTSGASFLTLASQRIALDLSQIEGQNLHRLSFRTGQRRGVGKLDPVPAGSDHPQEPVRFVISDFSMR